MRIGRGTSSLVPISSQKCSALAAEGFTREFQKNVTQQHLIFGCLL